MSEELKNCKTSNDASIQLTKNFLDKISFKGPQQAIETSYQNIENVFRINRNNDIASFFLDEKIIHKWAERKTCHVKISRNSDAIKRIIIMHVLFWR